MYPYLHTHSFTHRDDVPVYPLACFWRLENIRDYLGNPQTRGEHVKHHTLKLRYKQHEPGTPEL